MPIHGRGQMTLTDMNDVVASVTAPASPIEGALWFNTSTQLLYVYASGKWIITTDASKSINHGYRYYEKIVVYGASTSEYYPVVIKGGDQNVKRDILIKRGYSEQAPIDWNTSTHKGGLTVKLKTNFGGWGGANYSWEVHELEEMYSKTFGGAVLCGNSTMFAIFLRGGGTTGAVYHIYSDQPLDSNLYSGGVNNVPSSPQIALASDLIFHSGTYLSYAPAPRTYTQAVIDEIASRNFIKLGLANEATITSITETIGNMANDNILDYQERQIVKDRMTDVVGSVLTDTEAMPFIATLETAKKGEAYNVRQSALNAGVLGTDPKYVAVANQYNNLKTYLDALTPVKPWDVSLANKDKNITVVKATFRTHWLNYYTAILELANLTENKLKESIDSVEKTTGNILDNITMTGLVGRWNTGVVPTIASIDFQGKVVPTLKSTNTGDAQYVHQKVKVDPSKAYEVTMWFKQDISLGSSYLGLYAYNSLGTQIPSTAVDVLTSTTVSNLNLYAIGDTVFTPINTWVKKTFYILPAGTNPLDMTKIGDGVTHNFIMSADTREIAIRYLNYGNSTSTKTLWVAQPKMAEVDPNSVTNVSKLDKRVYNAEQKITNEAIVSTVVASDNWTVQASKINQTADKISIVVSDTNKINAQSIASEIAITPTAISLISNNIDITGKVTFNALDSTMKTDINTHNSWKAVGKTTINGGMLEANTVKATHIDTSTLVVGTNIAMGANASISWTNVSSKPVIPTTASQVGARPDTWIPTASQVGALANSQTAVFNTLTNNGTSSGLFMSGANLYINASYINGGTITGVNINVSTDVTIGNALKLGGGVYSTQTMKSIQFNGTDSWISTYGGGLSIDTGGQLKVVGSDILFNAINGIDFNNVDIKNFTGVAKFG